MLLRCAAFVIIMLFSVANAQLSPEIQAAIAARDDTLKPINFELRAANRTEVQCATVEYYVFESFDDAIEKTRELFIARDWGLLDYALSDFGFVMLIDTDENNPRAVGLGGVTEHDDNFILWFSRCLQKAR